nr:hypothetical protein [Intestinimonas sp. MSJ-38]
MAAASHRATDGWRWCGSDRHYPRTPALRFVRLISRGAAIDIIHYSIATASCLLK